MHYNDQLRLLDSLVDSDETLPDNARVTFLESTVESVPDLQHVKITDTLQPRPTLNDTLNIN